MPIVSVVMPVYNGEKYLQEAIESILNQTFTDFEFIIINDGSVDSTERIIKSFNDNRIIYIKQTNSGIGYSLHVGCSIAKGIYIARMDADDISLPNRLLKQVKFLENNREYILIGSAVNYINEDGQFIKRSIPYITDASIKGNLKYGSIIAHPSVMFLRETYNKCHGYNKDIKLLEDYLLWLDMSKYGKYYNFCFPLLSYRQTTNSWYNKLNLNELKELKNRFYDLIIIENNYEKAVISYNEFFPRLYEVDKNQIIKINTIKKYNIIAETWNKTLINILFFLLCYTKEVYSYFRNSLNTRNIKKQPIKI